MSMKSTDMTTKHIKGIAGDLLLDNEVQKHLHLSDRTINFIRKLSLHLEEFFNGVYDQVTFLSMTQTFGHRNGSKPPLF